MHWPFFFVYLIDIIYEPKIDEYLVSKRQNICEITYIYD